MAQPQIDSSLDRRTQILDAALVCFAKRGFHQASMHDISAEAGISVGLIYRYFENKEAVISAMADRHKKEIGEVAELIFAVSRGMLMRDVLQPQEMTAAERRTRQLEVTRRLWGLLFRREGEPAYA